jgi:hypothetical protein
MRRPAPRQERLTSIPSVTPGPDWVAPGTFAPCISFVATKTRLRQSTRSIHLAHFLKKAVAHAPLLNTSFVFPLLHPPEVTEPRESQGGSVLHGRFSGIPTGPAGCDPYQTRS